MVYFTITVNMGVCYHRGVNQKKARLLRSFAKKFSLRLKAIKQTYYSIPSTSRHAFSLDLQSLISHAPRV